MQCPSSHSGPVSLACDTDGGKFTISGCKENKCKLPQNVIKFKALHCDGYVKPSDCGITCAPGYNSKDNSIFKICKQDQGEFELIGCTPNVCHFPSNLEGYNTRDCMGDLSADKCKVTCISPDYVGSPKVECLEHDGSFRIVGEACYRRSTPTTPSNGDDNTPTTKPNGGTVPSITTAAPKKINVLLQLT